MFLHDKGYNKLLTLETLMCCIIYQVEGEGDRGGDQLRLNNDIIIMSLS